MFRSHGIKTGRIRSILQLRSIHIDGRNRLSNFWTPTVFVERPQSESKQEPRESSHDLLIRAGFLRQAHSGVFHLLPLGLRVQDKLERLIDKHMLRIGASKVSLSSLSSEDLWARSGRLKGRDSEFLRLTDRKGAKYLLSPTHEEEITTIVGNAVKSYRDLPLRLYQVSRKYRDELRPRQGLLRGREFLMKDLYTFDMTEEHAEKTYQEVRDAYSSFLDELKLPYLTATADSGNMGGDLSHEYHFVSPHGEDTIISCGSCGYSINEELYVGRHDAQAHKHGTGESDDPTGDVAVDITFGISKDRKRLVKIVTPRDGGGVNMYAIKKLFAELDTSVEAPLSTWNRPVSDDDASVTVLVDPRCVAAVPKSAGAPFLLTKARPHDICPSCSRPSLRVDQAVEIGHTFHLSTRYSEPLSAQVLNAENELVPIQMGCHGIGVSRLIGTLAGLLMDQKGLQWPLAVAPFGAVMVATPRVRNGDTEKVYDELSNGMRKAGTDIDIVIDDRQTRLTGWKLNDADLVGYPFLLVLGKKWVDGEGKIELQCRRLGVKRDVELGELAATIQALRETL